MMPLFVDTNIPIYAAGRPHPLKLPCTQILELIAEKPHGFVTDAEVLQELLHRYLNLRLWPDPGLVVVENFALLMRSRVEAVSDIDVLAAAHSVHAFPRLSARDLLHLSIAQRTGALAIVSADRDFDGLPHMERLDPTDFERWRLRASS